MGAHPQLDRATASGAVAPRGEPEWTRSTKWSFPRRTTVTGEARQAPKAPVNPCGRASKYRDLATTEGLRGAFRPLASKRDSILARDELPENVAVSDRGKHVLLCLSHATTSRTNDDQVVTTQQGAFCFLCPDSGIHNRFRHGPVVDEKPLLNLVPRYTRGGLRSREKCGNNLGLRPKSFLGNMMD
jgi:hypothetical protein